MAVQMSFEGIKKAITFVFTEKNTSSDGGLPVIKKMAEKLGLIKGLSSKINDDRDQTRTKHELSDLISQRVFCVAAGYNELLAADKLKDDPVMKLITKNNNEALASDSTLCRLENHISIREVHDMTEYLVELYLKRNKARFDAKGNELTIYLDLDPTDISTYGNQQLAFFNGHYGNTCYLPMIIVDGENQDLIMAFLRSGTKHAKFLLISVLKRLFRKIRNEYPQAKFSIRADSGFQCDELLSFFESDTIGVTYKIALATNNVLINKTTKYEPTPEPISYYEEFAYKAESWTHCRRVCAAIETNKHGVNVRYTVTNDSDSTSEQIKLDYNKRSNCENVIKELKLYSGAENMSCHKFQANAFRLILACCSLVLYQELRKQLVHIGLHHNYVETLRTKLIKIAVKVIETTRRIVFHLPESYPYQDSLQKLVTSLVST